MTKLLILCTLLCGLTFAAGRRARYHTPAQSCDVKPSSRIRCGWKHINQRDCERLDCCYDNRKWRTYWCFRPLRFVTTCSGSGDVHYVTFDGKTYNFQGPCKYVLTTSTDGRLPQFTVMAKNWYLNGIYTVTWTEYVEVEIPGYLIRIDQGQDVYVNNGALPIAVPATLTTGVDVGAHGLTMRLSTDFGLTVDFNGHSTFKIQLSSDYQGSVEGLCGNYDSNPNDDPDAVTAPTWQIETTDNCTFPPISRADQRNETIDPDVLALAVEICDPLQNPEGPFQSQIQDPASSPNYYMDSCVMDIGEILASNEEGADNATVDAACEMFASFAGQILWEDRNETDWRDATGCNPLCPDGMLYDELAPGCPETCPESGPVKDCPWPASEGCVCVEGMVLNGGVCVALEDCIISTTTSSTSTTSTTSTP